MQINSYNKTNNNINFQAKLRLSDKGLLRVPFKEELVSNTSPMDFFFNETQGKKKLDIISARIKAYIRKKQQNPDNSEFLQKVLKKSFIYANKIRTVGSKLLALTNAKQFIKTANLIRKTKPEKPEYIDEWAKIGNSIKNKFITMNIEDGIIEKIAKANDSTIFILNHDNFERDKFIYPIFNSFLNYAYSALGNQASCPRPQIVVSQNFIKLVGSKFKGIYKKMGLISVDASMTERNMQKNILPIRSVINNLAENKINLFIFPEGNNSIYKHKSIFEKFQPGIAKIIEQSLDKKEQIRVVPIGIAYDNAKNSFGSINIGKPLYFKRIGEELFFNTTGTDDIKIGTLNKKRTVNDMVKILCENLQVNVDKSKLNLQ